jgi:hypothetical protein
MPACKNLIAMQDTNQTSLLRTILVTGLIAGSLDITGACTWAFVSGGTSPDVILKFIASGVFGREAAFAGGWPMAILGLVFHFIIAYSWTILFFLLYPHLKFLSRNRIVTAIGYGLVIWLVMNLLVLPLTRIPQRGISIKSAVIGALILMAAIGLPLSFRAARYFTVKKNPAS